MYNKHTKESHRLHTLLTVLLAGNTEKSLYFCLLCHLYSHEGFLR